jgi:putative FmdB family regulatory protein
MPIYDYTCQSCRRVTEVIHGINDHGPKFCPECGAEGTMTKAFVAPTVHFKGSGWAKKDRGSAARASEARDESTHSAGDSKGSSDGTGTDSGSGGTETKTKDAGTSGSTGAAGSSSGSSD